MKWQKLIPPISLILAGIVTMSMRVITSVNMTNLNRAITDTASYEDGNLIYDGTKHAVLHYSPLTYVIGALLIIAGAFMLYNELKEAKNANNQ